MDIGKFIYWLILLAVISCNPLADKHEPSQQEFEKEIEDWINDRVKDLKAEYGWLNLIGLHWLTHDSTAIGAHPSSQILIFKEQIPELLGYFVLGDSNVLFYPAIDEIYFKDILIDGPIEIFSSAGEQLPKVLSYKSIRWSIIKRGDEIGVRIRDLEAETLNKFKEIPRFPTRLDWRLNGTFTPYQPEKEILITNVIGQTSTNLSPGFVSFEKNGEKYQLDALEAGSQLYLILADASSGLESYGGGRYLYVDKPKQGTSEIVIDFNKAYNPPCVFTPFATCPLPPRQNILDLYIDAGEKYKEK